MITVAGLALWLGGFWWIAFVAAVTIGVFWEWSKLAVAFSTGVPLFFWLLAGLIYVGLASAMLVVLRSNLFGLGALLIPVGAVVATDVGAYFAGRAIGGPKIAQSISPSKTWAGLAGGMVASAIIVTLGAGISSNMFMSIGIGAAIAIIAQSGDFLESWMKRRAGVKDSGSLLPGHGGLLDRVDGLIAVMFVGALAVIFDEFVVA